MTNAIEGVLDYSAWWTNNGHTYHRTARVGNTDVLQVMRAWLESHAAARFTLAHRGVYPHFNLAVGALADHTDVPRAWEPNAHPACFGLLVVVDGFGFTNLDLYVEQWFQSSNHSRVRIELDDAGMRFVVCADTVPVLDFTHSNTCAIDDAFVARHCRPGEGADTCAFLTMGCAGWSCAKFDGSTCRTLLDRVANGTMHARHIGACRRGWRREGGVNTLESTVVKDSIPVPPEVA